jgi:hypothetical protein
MDYKYKYIKYKEKYIRLKPKLSGGNVNIIFSDILYNNLKKKFEGFNKYRNLFTNTDKNKKILIDKIEERKKIIEVDIKKEESELEYLNNTRTTELNDYIKDGILIRLNYVKEQINFFEDLIINLETDKDKINSKEYNSNTHNILIKKYMTEPIHYRCYEDLIDIIKFEEGNSIKFINGIKKLSKNNISDLINIKIKDNKNIIKIRDSSEEKYIKYNTETIVL